MWIAQTEQLTNTRAIHFAIQDGAAPLPYADAIDLWQTSARFRKFFIGLLSAAPFPALRWETPPVTTTTANQPFEFVLLDSPAIALPPDSSAFAEHLATAKAGDAIEFPNLGNDAVMVVPCPPDPPPDYAHLAAYLRNSSESEQHALWESVGAAMRRRLGSKPVWLNTAGGGVAWLHVRLDDGPKYYGYSPYREVR